MVARLAAEEARASSDGASTDLEALRSASWDRASPPRISVVVATYQRAAYVADLVRALEAQSLPPDEFEVVVVDDASTDGTWAVLADVAARTPLQLLALRNDRNRGPGASRNRGVASSHGTFLAFTDDDCLPTGGWLTSLLDELGRGATVVQGRVTPPDDEWDAAGPWDHTIWVRRPSPFFETCNVAYARDQFEAAGGFDTTDPLLRPDEGRHFGEDAVLACRVLSGGGRRAFADAAVVHHRCIPAGYGDWLRAQRQVAGFPGLARRSPIFGRWLRWRVFLSTRSASFDLGVASVLLAAASRRAWPLVGVLPWGWIRGHDALSATRGDRVRAVPVLAQLAVGDLVTLVSLVQGSARHRRIVL